MDKGIKELIKDKFIDFNFEADNSHYKEVFEKMKDWLLCVLEDDNDDITLEEIVQQSVQSVVFMNRDWEK